MAQYWRWHLHLEQMRKPQIWMLPAKPGSIQLWSLWVQWALATWEWYRIWWLTMWSVWTRVTVLCRESALGKAGRDYEVSRCFWQKFPNNSLAKHPCNCFRWYRCSLWENEWNHNPFRCHHWWLLFSNACQSSWWEGGALELVWRQLRCEPNLSLKITNESLVGRKSEAHSANDASLIRPTYFSYCQISVDH